MKSIVIEKPNTLTIETRALPQPAPGEVRIKVQSRPDRRTGIRRSGDQLRALLPLFSR